MYNIFEDNDDERIPNCWIVTIFMYALKHIKVFLVYQFATMPELYFVLFMRDIY